MGGQKLQPLACKGSSPEPGACRQLCQQIALSSGQNSTELEHTCAALALSQVAAAPTRCTQSLPTQNLRISSASLSSALSAASCCRRPLLGPAPSAAGKRTPASTQDAPDGYCIGCSIASGRLPCACMISQTVATTERDLDDGYGWRSFSKHTCFVVRGRPPPQRPLLVGRPAVQVQRLGVGAAGPAERHRPQPAPAAQESKNWRQAGSLSWQETAAGLHGKLKAGVLQMGPALGPERGTR